MQRLIYLLTLLLTTGIVQATGTTGVTERIKYKDGPSLIYRIYLTDKMATPYSIERPSRYLSRRSLERRRRQHIVVDSTDLPVSNRYIHQIERQGGRVVGQSRWQNTLLVSVDDSIVIQHCRLLPCVRSCRLVWQAPDSITPTAKRNKHLEQFEHRHFIAGQPYGNSYEQIKALQGHRLHDIGMHGEGMMIAVLDGGFRNVDRIPAFLKADICGYRDFVNPPSPSIFAETDHGTKVLSAMAVNEPNYYIGTAPKSSFWLLRTEDLQTEQEVEEDYWVMAAEFADSVGCDIINSSLGYNVYDSPDMTHKLWHLDGRTAFVSQVASILASKGIIMINSAGHSGMGRWKKIGVPADADNILTIGAIVADSVRHIAPFSSVGPSQDGRIKPDLVAIGAPAFLVNGRGAIMEDMGTSFSTPIICGLMACLWQALPYLTAKEMIQLIRSTGNNFEHPDNIYGYGLPNFWKAYMIGKTKHKK